MYKYVLMLHLLGATVWTGGHLVLGSCVLPRALRQRSPDVLLEFEKAYEKIGMPALLVQVATGFWLASLRVPDWSALFHPVGQGQSLVTVKLLLLLATAVVAANARLRIIPRLSPENLPVLAWHIGTVTVLSVLFVIAGVGLRTGGLF